MNDNGWRTSATTLSATWTAPSKRAALPKKALASTDTTADNNHICYVGGVDANDVNIAQDPHRGPGLHPWATPRTSPSVSRASCGSRAISEFDPGKAVSLVRYPATLRNSTVHQWPKNVEASARTSKVWLAINMVLVWIAIYLSIWTDHHPQLGSGFGLVAPCMASTPGSAT